MIRRGPGSGPGSRHGSRRRSATGAAAATRAPLLRGRRQVRPTARHGPSGGGQREWPGQRGCSCGGGSRGSWPGGGCSAGTYACSRCLLSSGRARLDNMVNRWCGGLLQSCDWPRCAGPVEIVRRHCRRDDARIPRWQASDDAQRCQQAKTAGTAEVCRAHQPHHVTNSRLKPSMHTPNRRLARLHNGTRAWADGSNERIQIARRCYIVSLHRGVGRHAGRCGRFLPDPLTV